MNVISFAFYDGCFEASYELHVQSYRPYCTARIDSNTAKTTRVRSYLRHEGRVDIVPKDSHGPDKGNILFDTETGYMRKWDGRCKFIIMHIIHEELMKIINL